MNCMRYLSRRELKDELFSILGLCNAFLEVGFVGGERQKEMIKAMPKQIATRIMELQDLIDKSYLENKQDNN